MKILFPALLLSGVLALTPLAHAQTSSDTLALADYRVALDQLAAGNAAGARLLLQGDLERGEMAPECAALLAYLEEKANQPERAQQALQGVAAPTGFTTAYLERLGGGAMALEMGRRDSVATSRNPAVLESSDARAEKLENLMFEIVNNERKNRGLAALTYDKRMASIARAHSAEMRDKRYFAHESPTPALRDPLDRYVAGTGQRPRLVAENIYRIWGSRSFLTERDIRDAHQALMDSPGHRSNLLLAGASHIGIGISTNSAGHLWITQLFARN